jgi:hypothetical protein
MTKFWQWAPMGGEVHPSNSYCFKPSYPAGTVDHQDFNVCTNETHATYMAWNRGFHKGGVGMGPEQNAAKFASARMGYNYIVQNIGLVNTGNNVITMEVKIQQVGIAPFYYDLFLNMYCDGSKNASTPIPNAALQKNGDVALVSLSGIQAASSCFSSIELQLGSSYMYSDKPILWAQGLDGRVIITSVPLPNETIPQPSRGPVRVPSPVAYPVPILVPVDQPSPRSVPTRVPWYKPTAVPMGASKGQIVGCYIICAGKKCNQSNTFLRGRNRKKSRTHGIGNIFRGRIRRKTKSIKVGYNYKRVPQWLVGIELSVMCDISVAGIEQKVKFEWPVNETNTEMSSPYTMEGKQGLIVTPVDYLSVPGNKTVTVRVFDMSNVQTDYTILYFRIE